MKIVQMDRLDFSDHFSYIICLIWSYRIKVMNFLKFKLYSGISYIRLIPENQLLRQPDVSVTSAGQRDTSGSNLTVGPACQCD